MSIAQNLDHVREQMDIYCNKAGVPPESVTLVAVSKTQPDEAIMAAYEAGQRVFGENKVQEWRAKSEQLPDDIVWNLIGHLQTNKVKFIIAPQLALLQSLDRYELAKDLHKQCEKENRALDVLIQLNISREDTKSGIFVEDLDRFLEDITGFDRLCLRGLMTIGPNTDDEGRIRDCFAKAKQLYDKLAPQIQTFKYLSMGMSHDYGLAILEGSNMIRVGTSIFGARDYTASATTR